METNDIANNMETGKEIFENIPIRIRPFWGGLILSRFDHHIENIPPEIKDIFPIIHNNQKWKDANEQFSKIKRFMLRNKSFQPETYLSLAEMVAKVTFNSALSLDVFEKDNGWYIPKLAVNTALFFNDDRLLGEVEKAIFIFDINKKFVNNLIAAQDFLIYQKIDDILWYDWDPIGVNSYNQRDEYQSYVSPIFQLKKSGASIQTIASLLLNFETESMGLSGNLKHCLIIANKIILAH